MSDAQISTQMHIEVELSEDLAYFFEVEVVDLKVIISLVNWLKRLLISFGSAPPFDI
ncbi:MAG: hypothetical protein QNL02_10040 [Paracoccaceae bacterium]